VFTKSWSTKADFEAGTLTNLWVPSGMNQLELAYGELSGTGVWIVDGAAGWSNPHNRQFNWQTFEHTKDNIKTIWRDDFRADSRSKYPLHNMPKWNDGAGVPPGYDAANKRLIINTGGSNGTTLEIPGLSIQNVIASMKVYITGGYPTNQATATFLRFYNSNNNYIVIHEDTSMVERSQLFKWVNGVYTVLVYGTKYPFGTWRTLYGSVNGTNLKGWTDEYTMSKTDGSHTSAGKVLLGCWQWKGYITDFLVEHFTLPDPPNCSVSFKFWVSKDGENWEPEEYTDIDIGVRVPSQYRYIKVQVTMSRESLAKAMPVLNSMTLTYKLLVSPIFI